ncbi:hypothetical protein Tco_0487813 [Tanacetum coccineum]
MRGPIWQIQNILSKAEAIFQVKKQMKTLIVTNVAKKEEVSEDEEMTQVKVLMALVDDELVVGKNHARNSEWIDITMRKILKAKAKPFPPCTHCGCHHPGDCRNYPECAISEAMTISPQDIIVSFKGGVLAESS